MVLVNPLANKQDLPRFRPPKIIALRLACLVLIAVFTGELQCRDRGCDLARVSGDEYERVPNR